MKTVVNVLEETVNVIEEALEESPRLREFISDSEQWLQLWAEHIDSFRSSIRDYYGIFNQSPQTSQQISLIRNSIHLYSIQVTQYVQLVQEYCLNLLLEGGESCFPQIEERLNSLNESLSNVTELADVPRAKARLLEFKNLVIAIDQLLCDQRMSLPENSHRFDAQALDNYCRLVDLLRTNIANWENRISLHESAVIDDPFSADYLLDTYEEIRQFLTDLSGYTRLVQEIYRNLLEL